MANDMTTPSFDAPIAGQSLTAELGNRPWQQPPQYATIEEALEFYIPRLTDPTFSVQLMDVVEMGVPLVTIANSMQLGAVMEGKHSVDVGILILPVLVELMAYLADEAGVEYKTGIEPGSRPDSEGVDPVVASAMRNMKKKPAMEEQMMPVEEEPVAAEAPRGLLARRG